MKEPRDNQEIDQLFRKRFENFTSEPSPALREEIFNRIGTQESKTKKFNYLRYGIAAAVLLFIGSMLLINFLNQRKSPTLVATKMPSESKNTQDNRPAAPADRPVQETAKQDSISSERQAIEPVKEVDKKRNGFSTMERTIASGAVPKQIVLPDSSHITLQAHGSIRYLDNFMEERKVTLTGKAFFAVQKHAGKNFKVVSGRSVVEVLGTAFHVFASETSIDRVEVLEGRVAYYRTDRQDKKVYLSMGESGFYNSDQMPEKSPAKNIQQPLEEPGLVFKNTPMSEVIAKLNTFFSEKIAVQNKEILTCTYSGTFTNPKRVEEVLEVVTGSLGLTYARQNDKIVLSGNGCK